MATDNPLSAFFRGFQGAQKAAQAQQQQEVENELSRQLRAIQQAQLQKQLTEASKPLNERFLEAFLMGKASRGEVSPFTGAVSTDPALAAQQAVLGPAVGIPEGLQAPGLSEALAQVTNVPSIPGVPQGLQLDMETPTERQIRVEAARRKETPVNSQFVGFVGNTPMGFNPRNNQMEPIKVAGGIETAGPLDPKVKPSTSSRGRSVLAVDPKGKLTNIVLGAGESLPEGFKEKVRGGDAASLRKEFNLLKEVKSYKELSRQVGLMRTAYDQLGKGGGKGPVDQALITTYNKILDPDSVVRESEYARTPEGVALLNRIQGKIQQFTQGGVPFTDADRSDLLNTANALFDTAQDSYEGTKQFYSAIAEQSGIDPELVIKDQRPTTTQEGVTTPPKTGVSPSKDPLGVF